MGVVIRVCVLCRARPKNSNPQRKALQRLSNAAPLLSHPPPLPLERDDREEEERRRVRVSISCAGGRMGKKMELDRNLQINKREILRAGVQMSSEYEYSSGANTQHENSIVIISVSLYTDMLARLPVFTDFDKWFSRRSK